MDKNSVKPLEELLDSVRDIDGFPIAKDEDILALSDPPFYTACPNPYIETFIEEYGKPYESGNDQYFREPFSGDVSEGKNDYIYNAHSYSTKVPYKAIKKFIRHYTEPGDIVYDGFCGTGMTGVAAIATDRHAIINDLSTLASFISSNYNKKVNINVFNKKMDLIVDSLEKEVQWMYETKHDNNRIGIINSTIWSDTLYCPYCKKEFIYWDLAVIDGKINSNLKCECGAEFKKKECEKVFVNQFDTSHNKIISIVKQVPVQINYTYNKKSFTKKPDSYDYNLLKKINEIEIPYWYPRNELPKGYNTEQPKKSHGYTHVDLFFTKRTLYMLSYLFKLINDTEIDKKFVFTSIFPSISKLYRYRTGGGGSPSNNLYIPSLTREQNLLNPLKKKIKQIISSEKQIANFNDCKNLVSTQSSTDLSNFKINSIDYIFTDPPFGENIMYSELNFIAESWLKVFTGNKKEAIVNKFQNKALEDYTSLMTSAFSEMYRILKPNRWITIVFHNSKASVWNAIQESVVRSGFIIAQVTTLDKKQGSFKQVTSAGAVKNDLIINAYKPKEDFSNRFIKNAGKEMEIDFVKEQLNHLPVKPNIERTETMLYSKMIAHYVENGFKIVYNATNFYSLLSENFSELDGYWFTDDQVKSYNKWKSGLSLDQLKEVLDGQQVLLVTDEKSAITWIYNFLKDPKDYNDIYTSYQKITASTDDKMPELKEILDQNFILEKGRFRRPISDEEREKIAKNRDKELNQAFTLLLEQAKAQKGKIKEVRLEALVHGFTKCYREGKYQDILTIADKLYASTLESSGDIMDFVDIARIKTKGSEDL